MSGKTSIKRTMAWHLIPKVFVLILLVSLLAIQPCHADSENQITDINSSEQKEATVLLIISYNDKLPFYQNFREGLETSFSQSPDDITLVTEYLDVLQYEDEDYLPRLADLYAYKISTLDPDAIIVVEWSGYSMLNSSGIISQSQIPILYYGDIPMNETLPDNVISFYEPQTAKEVYETIALISDLKPDTKQIVIIAGNGADEQEALKNIRQIIPAMNLSIPVEYITDVSYDELITRVSDLPDDTAILFYLFLQDKNGNPYIPVLVLQELHKQTDNPIFGLFDPFLGNGVVGGYVFSAEKLGETIGDTALKIVDETPLENVSIDASQYYSYMFDWGELNNQSISTDQLPPGSQILFKEESFWEQYWQYILVLFSIFLIEGVIIVILLIERRNRIIAEAGLRKSEERFRILIEQAPEAIIVFDGDTRKIVDANRNAELLFSTRRDALIKKGFQDYYTEDQPDHLPYEQTISEHIKDVKEGKEYSFERKIRQPSGNEIICEVRLSLLPSEGHTLIRGSYIDITERKRSEELLEKRVVERTRELNILQEAYKLANQKLNILTGITRHDILNAITGLKGYLEFSLEEELPKSAKTFVEKCVDITNQIQRLIEFTRVYENIGNSEAIWQDVSGIIDNIRDMMKNSNLTFKVETGNLQIYADPMLEKVFYTLVENTLRHGEKATEVRLNYEKTDDGLTLVYSDNGVGIPDDDKLSIFKRGFGKHTGLGLYISQEILAITHIQITETGEYGKGARFIMFIPPEYFRLEPDELPEEPGED
jgi:PAS domain S-box-containing protein